jgi:hypothetical protein
VGQDREQKWEDEGTKIRVGLEWEMRGKLRKQTERVK